MFFVLKVILKLSKVTTLLTNKNGIKFFYYFFRENFKRNKNRYTFFGCMLFFRSLQLHLCPLQRSYPARGLCLRSGGHSPNCLAPLFFAKQKWAEAEPRPSAFGGAEGFASATAPLLFAWAASFFAKQMLGFTSAKRSSPSAFPPGHSPFFCLRVAVGCFAFFCKAKKWAKPLPRQKKRCGAKNGLCPGGRRGLRPAARSKRSAAVQYKLVNQ